MTSGTNKYGFKRQVVGNTGSTLTEYLFYSEKNWAGGDRAYTVETQHPEDNRPRTRIIRARKGREVVEVEWVSKIKRSTRRVFVEPDIPHAYDMSLVRMHDPIFTTYWEQYGVMHGPFETTAHASGFGPVDQLPPWTSNDDLTLQGRLRNKLAGSSFNALVSGSQSKQAIEMIFDSARKIRLAYSHARRGNLSFAAQILSGSTRLKKGRRIRTPASNWLELQYGWLPLLADVEDAAIYLAEKNTRPRERKVVARLKQGADVGKATASSTVVGKSSRRAQLIAYVKAVDEAQLLGLQDPLSVAWELLPYSFVLDWFIPVGNYLQCRALSSSLTATFVKTVTERLEATAGDYVDQIGTARGWSSGCNLRQESISVKREVFSTLPVPMPSLKRWSEITSLRRAANAVALTVNASGKLAR